MKLSKIAHLLGTDDNNIPEVDIHWLLTDSRSLSFPSGTLFFALKTSRNDGHRYIAELYRQNLRYFVVSEMLPDFETLTDAVFIHMDDTLQALQTLAAAHRAEFSIPVIGITGSNGKTVVKEWLYQMLHTDFRIVRSPRSYNSQIGVPLSVWSLSDSSELAIFEAGISRTGEMQKLQPIIRPTIGIFTNLGDAHQEGFTGLKQKCDEKMKLFIDSEVLIYNSDNKLVDISIAQAGLKARLFSWGKKADTTVQVLKTEKTETGTILYLKYQEKKFELNINFSDDASIENAMQCICTMLYLNYKSVEINKRLLNLETVAMRLEVKEGNHDCLLINDTYNSDLNSLSIALSFLNQQSTKKNLSRTLILSDILQSGHSSEELYELVARLVQSKNIHRMIGVGEVISSYADRFQTEEKYFFRTTDDLLKSPLMREFSKEIILLKGSRSFHFEDILAKLELIVHETTLDVDLNALVDNLNYFRSKLRPETKIMCMVKAFAYGSGSVEVARTLQNNRCDYLAVAVGDEGAELRREGIRVPIVVMNPEKGAFGTIFDNKLEPEIYSFRLLKLFMVAAEKLALTDYPIHIKIDTGMHRLGFNPEDMSELTTLLANQNQLKVRSVFSHLVGSDSPQFDDFTRQQLELFTRCADELSKPFSHKIMRHILNSAGIERFPEFQFDMVRLGIGHYGITALPNVKLATVCTLKTIILQIRDVKAGDTVGYSRKGKITRDSRIGVIPIGYADGFDRHLGNGTGEVWVNGCRAKVVGNVCMDAVMIDLTGIPASEGDEVEIFGKNISIDEVAEKLQTIPYEILTSVSRRVKRVYFIS
ncbi:MAG TPA: bifunctional UDP-N-acetylmuramoyl-tripeptide:D-alanyl-D-alanine ligase/alanine racemase [Paludibacteraceae bacterium]|nr:bifunctional UDP-N-acetylmuramoyl-tripeptide:D-alanyl-D-alanine ligase/alanine racemase [Paludibacteraceae bacterium]